MARYAVSTYLEKGATPKPPADLDGSLQRRGRVFVTILSVIQGHTGSTQELRGCMGYLQARLQLAKATINAAINAATTDPRFPRMNRNELERVVFEVNVLSERHRLAASSPTEYPKMINVGIDGLVISQGQHRGLLLPGIPVEWRWSAEEFLTQCSLKAGLPPDAWIDADTRVERFQSEIFREVEPAGSVIRINLKPIPAPRS